MLVVGRSFGGMKVMAVGLLANSGAICRITVASRPAGGIVSH